MLLGRALPRTKRIAEAEIQRWVVGAYRGSNAREVERRADRHSGEREPDAKQKSKVGSPGVWMTHAGIKRAGRTHTGYSRFVGTG